MSKRRYISNAAASKNANAVRVTAKPKGKDKRSPAQKAKVYEPALKLPGKPIQYLTGMGKALGAQNERTEAELRKAGVIMPRHAGSGMGFHADSPFYGRGEDHTKMARIGASIAGVREEVNPIVWPDMKKIEEEARKPMSEATKARLSALPRKKHNNGDPVAMMLERCKNLEQVYLLGAQHFKMKVPDLKDKYKHLNPGQQRMVIGNRLRAMWRGGKLTIAQIEKGTK